MNRQWKVIPAALLLLAGQAFADNVWLPLKATRAQGKFDLYLNTKTFQRQGPVVNVMVRQVYKKIQEVPFLNLKYDSQEQLAYLECAERKMVLAKADYFLAGKRVHSTHLTPADPYSGKPGAFNPQPVPPASVEEEAFNQVCKYGQDKQ